MLSVCDFNADPERNCEDGKHAPDEATVSPRTLFILALVPADHSECVHEEEQHIGCEEEACKTMRDIRCHLWSEELIRVDEPHDHDNEQKCYELPEEHHLEALGLDLGAVSFFLVAFLHYFSLLIQN